MKEGFKIPAEGADFYPSEIVDPGLTEDRYVKWVQIIPEAYCCVHHSHVYVSVPETAEDLESFRLGMGSNTEEIDLIEYAMGSTGQFYPDGTGRKLPAGGLFRFAPHYHPWGEETIDRQKVGIKFYPKGVVPELIVTAHRIRTGLGHDWKLNREAVEDRLLRAGFELDLHADRILATSTSRVGTKFSTAHAFSWETDVTGGDSCGWSSRSVDRCDELRANVADRLSIQGSASVSEGHDSPYRLVA